MYTVPAGLRSKLMLLSFPFEFLDPSLWDSGILGGFGFTAGRGNLMSEYHHATGSD